MKLSQYLKEKSGLQSSHDHFKSIISQLYKTYGKQKETFSKKLRDKIDRAGFSFSNDKHWIKKHLENLTGKKWVITNKDFAFESEELLDQNNGFKVWLNESELVDYNKQLKLVQDAMKKHPDKYTSEVVKKKMDDSIKAYQRAIRGNQTTIKRLKQDQIRLKDPKYSHRDASHLDSEIKELQKEIDTHKANIKTAKKIQKNL